MRRLAFLLLLSAAPACRGAQGTAVAPIPVVHSWSDLLATKALKVQDDNFVEPGDTLKELPNVVGNLPVQGWNENLPNLSLSLTGTAGKPALFHHVWIGIDRDRTTSKSGVVLYCASQGVAFERETPADLGPFRVVVRPSRSRTLAQFSEKPLVPSNFAPSTYVLASYSIPLDAAGDYVIELVEQQLAGAKMPPRVFARTTVHVAGAPAQAWLPWDEPPTPAPVTPASGNEIVDTSVSNPAACYAIPKASSDACFYPAQIVPYMSLPQLIPNPDNVGAHLTIDGDTLRLEARDLCWPQPKERCLTRWWVNDKPFLPARDSSDYDRVFQGGNGHAPDDVPTAICFHLSFLPDRLGAKKGDKISVQLLYCPRGIDRCANPSYEIYTPVFSVPEIPPENFSSLSNRVDFIYSGDPANPVAP
jgi:hypothetical protein